LGPVGHAAALSCTFPLSIAGVLAGSNGPPNGRRYTMTRAARVHIWPGAPPGNTLGKTDGAP